MLLAAELALIAIDPGSGRHTLGSRDNLNACLAGLLVVELHLEDRPESDLLTAAGEVLAEAGPKTKSVLSAMSRGLDRRVGMGTWDAVVAELVEAGVVAPTSGGIRPRNEVVDRAARDAVVQRLRLAAAGDEPLDARVRAMTGPAQLLELVAPDRSARQHARRRIDHALDATSLQPIAESVRKVLADAAAAAAAAASVAAIAAATGST